MSISDCKTVPYLEFDAFCRWDHLESDNLLLRVTEEPLKVPEEVLDELFYIGFYNMYVVNSILFSQEKTGGGTSDITLDFSRGSQPCRVLE